MTKPSPSFDFVISFDTSQALAFIEALDAPGALEACRCEKDFHVRDVHGDRLVFAVEADVHPACRIHRTVGAPPVCPQCTGRAITERADAGERLIGHVQGYRDAYPEGGPADHLAAFAEACLRGGSA